MEYIQGFVDSTARWYHIPVSTIMDRTVDANIMMETKFLAPIVYEAATNSSKIRGVYRVVSIEIKKRHELTIEQAGSSSESQDEYWLLGLAWGYGLTLPILAPSVRTFHVFHTSEQALSSSISWQELPRRYFLVP